MCLLIGPVGVGKTLLLKTLQSGNYDHGSKGSSDTMDGVPATIPTTGTNLTNVVVYKKLQVTIREVGGTMGPIWQNYYKDARAIMYMIDMSNRCQVAAACIQLLMMVTHPQTASTPILLLLNKKDLSPIMSRSELEWLVRLEEIQRSASQKIKVLEISARSGTGLDQVARWVYDHHRDLSTMQPQS